MIIAEFNREQDAKRAAEHLRAMPFHADVCSAEHIRRRGPDGLMSPPVTGYNALSGIETVTPLQELIPTGLIVDTVTPTLDVEQVEPLLADDGGQPLFAIQVAVRPEYAQTVRDVLRVCGARSIAQDRE